MRFTHMNRVMSAFSQRPGQRQMRVLIDEQFDLGCHQAGWWANFSACFFQWATSLFRVMSRSISDWWSK